MPIIQCGRNLGKSKEIKITEEDINMLQTKKRYKVKGLNNELNRECRKGKEIFLNNIFQDIIEAIKFGLINKAYGMVRRFLGKEKLKKQILKG